MQWFLLTFYSSANMITAESKNLTYYSTTGLIYNIY